MSIMNSKRPVLTAGVDEAGRGPLAGPVVVGAVILDPTKPIAGLDDSKKLSARRRESLFDQIQRDALAWSIIEVGHEEVDELNILQASLAGMRRAVAALDPLPELALVDGNRDPGLGCQTRTLVQGDSLEPCISAASILAKVSRDRYMLRLHEQHPEYGFDRHKGYPTVEHRRLLAVHGPCPQHRKSFAPVRNAMQNDLL